MIEMKNIEIRYGDFVAIHELNLEIQDGEFFTFLGPSGCGKTTTLRALAGFTPPSKGSVIVNGKDITHVPVEHRDLGMVFQSYALFPTMTVFDNIAFGLRVDKEKEDYIKERVGDLAKLVNLTDEQLQKNVSELSGGQQQRIAIARALAKKPEIVLFDEPLSNLDAKLRKQLREELKRIQKETGMTAVYVTHDQEEALVLSDHIAVFDNGYVAQVGTPTEIYDHSATEFVCNFIGEANKLGTDLINYLNSKSDVKINPENNNYIRQEKIKTWILPDDAASIPILGKVVNKEFYGLQSVYDYEIHGSIVRSNEKEDGNKIMEVGDEVTLYVDPHHILSYEVE
ncbi:MAG: ABC transporter ATP-binding protein [Tissierellia bacterium]|nr:ABC transporter ATP-binding protein [Tissierellia bacterium]